MTPQIAAAADLTSCALVENACASMPASDGAPSEAVCKAQRDAATWTSDECAEAK
jgi:hypothetical protein